MENSPYAPPTAELRVDENVLETSFATLNIWRKIYLVFIWIATLLSAGMMGMVALEDSELIIVGVVLAALIVGFTYWTHWAIVRRKVGHITAIAILNLIPGGNIVGCLIMFAIRHVTVNEHKNYKIENS